MLCLRSVVVGLGVLVLLGGFAGALQADDDLPGTPVRPQPGDPKSPDTVPPVPPAGTVPPGGTVPLPDAPPAAAPKLRPASAVPAKRKTTLDKVRLKNGSEWVGRIVRDDATCVVVERVSDTGGVTRVTLPRADIALVQHGRDQDEEPVGSKLVRNEWFLLQSDGRVVGTRNVRVSRVITSALDGWRIEEEILEFAQGPRLPATRIRTVEVTNHTFHPVLIDFRETTEGAKQAEDRYERRLSGRVNHGVWSCALVMDGNGDRREIIIPEGVRGRLGHREHRLRQERAIGLATDTILDASQEGLVEVRTGFVSVDDKANPRGDEFHWHFADRRLISRFTRDRRAAREEIAEGVVALPTTEARCRAAAESEAPTGDAESSDSANAWITLVRPGLRFKKPDGTWTWQPFLDQPANTGAKRLGLLRSPIFLADALFEWHPESFHDFRDDAEVEQWLLQRLREKDVSLKVLLPRGTLPRPPGVWRFDLQARLKGENVRTAVIVINRRPGRAVILFACPVAAWAQGEAALQTFLNSLELI